MYIYIYIYIILVSGHLKTGKVLRAIWNSVVLKSNAK